MGTVLLLRLDELETSDRPVDAIGNLRELSKSGAGMPELVDAALGRGRAFISSDADGLVAVDADSGSTLVTRDASIQVVMRWDVASAATYGLPQTIYARGKGTSAAEYTSAGLELRVVNSTLSIGEVRWIWHDLAGNLKTQVGGHFQVPADGFVMITATRRWVSSSRVVLRYYLGDALLSEVESVDGEIGGGTTGTTQIGTRYTGAAYGRHLDGVIDELRVTDYELAPEEVEATYRRITVEQPRGYQLIREMHDPGFPISQDPASRAQRETRQWGHGIGFAAAQAENVRANILPDRAYGEALVRWERITKQSSKPGDDIALRRKRVIGKIRQRRGASIPGIGDALAGPNSLLDTDASRLEVIAFDQTTRDTWETLNAQRWRHDPAANFTIDANALRMQSAGVAAGFYDWRTSLQSVGGHGRGVKILAKMSPTTIADQGEAGLVFVNRGTRDGVLLGLRNDAGTYKLVRANFRAPINGGIAAATVLATPGLVPVWMILEHVDGVNFRARWSTVSASGPWDEATFTHPVLDGTRGGVPFHWAGFYGRTWSYTAAGLDVKFDDTVVRAPYGERSFYYYVLRDPDDPGSPDIDGANAVLRGLRQAHTFGGAVLTTLALYGDPQSLYGITPMGGGI